MKAMMHKSILAATMSCALVAGATDRTWDGGGEDDLMSTRENWSGDTAPGSSDTAIVHANAAKPAIVPSGSTTYSALVIGGHGSDSTQYGDGFIVQTNGTLTISGSDGLRIGRRGAGNPGTYVISNGTLTATTGSAFVGINGSTGRLVIAGNGEVTAANLRLASKGPDVSSSKTYGYLEISENGKLNVSTTFNMGNESGGAGYYAQADQSGGTVYANTLDVGGSSEAKYIQTGGTNAVKTAQIGIGAKGEYELSGGLFSVTNTLNIGHTGTGSLTLSGTGELETVGALCVGANGVGTLTITGGKVNAKDETRVGAAKAGTVEMSGGEVVFNKHFKIGTASNTATNFFNQTGGSVKMARNNGNNTFPYFGFTASSTGRYNISGGTFETTDTGIMIGNNGTGILDISGSGVVTIRGNVNLGFESNGKGTLILRDDGTLIANHVKKYQGTAVLAEFDGGTLQARQADTILKDLPNIQLKSHGLTLATETYNQTVMNCTFNVTDGGSITVTGSGKVTFSSCTLKFNNRPSGATYVFAEVADGSDATLEGLPTFAGDVCSDWRLKLSEDKKKILAVPPGLIIIFK